MKRIIYTCALSMALSFTSCSDFLDHQEPQGTLSDKQVKEPQYIDNLVNSAYAIWISA